MYVCPPHKGRLPYKIEGRLQEGRKKGFTPTGYMTEGRNEGRKARLKEGRLGYMKEGM